MDCNFTEEQLVLRERARKLMARTEVRVDEAQAKRTTVNGEQLRCFN
jgi:hypothetical protein